MHMSAQAAGNLPIVEEFWAAAPGVMAHSPTTINVPEVSEGASMLVSVYLASGRAILEDFTMLRTDLISQLLQAVQEAHHCPAGYEIVLQAAGIQLQMDHCAGDSGIQDGSAIQAVISMTAEVTRMLEQFEETNQCLRDRSLSGQKFGNNDDIPTVALEELQRLSRLAAPRAPAPSEKFEEWMVDECYEVRELAMWSIGFCGEVVFTLIPKLKGFLYESGEKAAPIRLEVIRTLIMTAARVDPKPLLPVIIEALYHPDGRVVYEVLDGVTRKMGGSAVIKDVAVPSVLALALHAVGQQVQRQAGRTLHRIDKEVWHKAMFPDLYDQDVWNARDARLHQRLSATLALSDVACRHSLESLAEKNSILEGDRLKESNMGLERLRAFAAKESLRRAQLTIEKGSGANTSVMPVRAEFDAACLRARMHAAKPGLSFVIEGEAAWECLPRCVIDCEDAARTSRSQLSTVAIEARNVQLRRYFSSKVGSLRTDTGSLSVRRGRLFISPNGTWTERVKHFFHALENIEGGDPVHSWLFPRKDRPPQHDFEPFYRELDRSLLFDHGPPVPWATMLPQRDAQRAWPQCVCPLDDGEEE